MTLSNGDAIDIDGVHFAGAGATVTWWYTRRDGADVDDGPAQVTVYRCREDVVIGQTMLDVDFACGDIPSDAAADALVNAVVAAWGRR